MTEGENIYSVFQALASEDILKLFATISCNDSQESADPKNKIILSFSKRNYSFFRRALPSIAFHSDCIKSIVFFESLAPVSAPTASGKIVGLCLDDSDEVEFALKQFSQLDNFEKHLVMIPRLTTLCQEAIDRSGLKIMVYEYHLEIIPLESYMFVVPSPQCFNRCFVENDINDVYTIASSILKLCLFTGCPEKVLAAGNVSCRVLSLLNQLKSQVGKSFFSKDGRSEFSQIFIVDRSADLLTPLATQFYYGGMLDETFGVDYGFLTLPEKVKLDKEDNETSTNEVKQEEIREVLLSDKDDEFFSNLRGRALLDALEQAEIVRNEIISLKGNMDKTSGTVQYSVFARRAKHLVDTKHQLYMHYDLLEELTVVRKPLKQMIDFEYSAIFLQDINDIEIVVNNLLNRRQYWHAIRLFCIASVATRGLPKANVADFQRRLLARFGFDVMKDLIGLEKCGLLTSTLSFVDQISKVAFNAKAAAVAAAASASTTATTTNSTSISTTSSSTEGKKKPRLSTINSELKLLFKEEPNQPDIEKGYDNYVPILHRLVQAGVNGQWEDKGSTVAKLMERMNLPIMVNEKMINSTPTKKVKSKSSNSITNGDSNINVNANGSATSINAGSNDEGRRRRKGPKKVLVFVIGGVTSTEIQLFKQMGKVLFNDKYEFHVGSTSITHGCSLIQSICHVIKSKL